jgi:hypothetical protein
MAAAAIFKRIRDFKAPSTAALQAELARQLRQFEDNVAAYVLGAAGAFLPRFSRLQSPSAIGSGQLAMVDTRAGNVSLGLAAPGASDVGLAAVVNLGAGTNTLTLRGFTCNVNGASSAVIAASCALLLCDGQNYWVV